VSGIDQLCLKHFTNGHALFSQRVVAHCVDRCLFTDSSWCSVFCRSSFYHSLFACWGVFIFSVSMIYFLL